jgi:hypothetical protein
MTAVCTPDRLLTIKLHTPTRNWPPHKEGALVKPSISWQFSIISSPEGGPVSNLPISYPELPLTWPPRLFILRAETRKRK